MPRLPTRGKTLQFTPGVHRRLSTVSERSTGDIAAAVDPSRLVSTSGGNTWDIDNDGGVANVDFAFIQDSELFKRYLHRPGLADSSNGAGTTPVDAAVWDFGGFVVSLTGTSDVWSVDDNWSTGIVPSNTTGCESRYGAANLPARLTEPVQSVETLEIEGPGDRLDIDGQSLTVLNVALGR